MRRAGGEGDLPTRRLDLAETGGEGAAAHREQTAELELPWREAPNAPAAEPAKPSYYWTWRLLSSGFPPDQCAAIRGIPRKTVFEHALQAVENGYEIRPGVDIYQAVCWKSSKHFRRKLLPSIFPRS